MVAYYPFDDGTADDQSGEGYDLTLYNGASITDGLIGQTLITDGANDSAHTALLMQDTPVTMNDFTFATRFKSDDIDNGLLLDMRSADVKPIVKLSLLSS